MSVVRLRTGFVHCLHRQFSTGNTRSNHTVDLAVCSTRNHKHRRCVERQHGAENDVCPRRSVWSWLGIPTTDHDGEGRSRLRPIEHVFWYFCRGERRQRQRKTGGSSHQPSGPRVLIWEGFSSAVLCLTRQTRRTETETSHLAAPPQHHAPAVRDSAFLRPGITFSSPV